MKYKLVLFDLDGTLTDTLEAIAKSVNSAFEELNLKTYSLAECSGLIGNGIAGIADKVFAMEKYDENTVTPEIMKKILRKHYSKHYNYNVKLYEGIDKLLDFLEGNNIEAGIVTNKDHELALDTVKKNLSKWKFVHIIGASDKEHPRKPSSYGIDKISEETGIGKEEILYVGDMDVDVQTAKNSGVDIVYCNWGFGKLKGEKNIPESIKVDTVNEIIDKIKA